MNLLNPKSVVDVGCGLGSWLAVFREHGVSEVLGVDGDWVDRGFLRMPLDSFLVHDLTTPLRIDKQFDLVVSLEVGEHLPAESADTFVDSLTNLGPAILFSSAVPFQGGTGHVNEQWPDYWVDRFSAHGYRVIDCVRRSVWTDERVEFCYAQNTLVLARDEVIDSRPGLQEALHCSGPISIVHPRLLTAVMQPKPPPTMRELVRALPSAASNALRHRLPDVWLAVLARPVPHALLRGGKRIPKASPHC